MASARRIELWHASRRSGNCSRETALSKTGRGAMTRTSAVVFLFDVDNTLIDNDSMQAHPSEHLEQTCVAPWPANALPPDAVETKLLRDSGERLVSRALFARFCGSINVMRRVDERDVGESLRKIAEQTPGNGVIFLGQQADIVA